VAVELWGCPLLFSFAGLICKALSLGKMSNFRGDSVRFVPEFISINASNLRGFGDVTVDDLILTGNNAATCAEFKIYLNNCFHIKDLGPLKYFLGIEVARNPKGLFLSQRKYTIEIIDERGLLGAKPVDFPLETYHKLALASGQLHHDPT